METVELAARSDTTVLFLGESGSGKDYWARRLHELSPRASGSFWSINCAVLPAELVESKLFGHEAGAFTGAGGRKRGLVELAEGGTLLLNEIGELPLGVQGKLLSFLDDHSFTRIGGEKTVTVDARIVAATNRDLEEFVKSGRFREDLYYRINVLAVHIPPLRERKEDIPAIVSETLASLAKSMGLQQVPVIDPGARQALMDYHWPGNIRELRNVLERAIILSEGEPISRLRLGLGGFDGTAGGSSEKDCLSAEVRVSSDVSMRDAISAARKSLITDALERSGGNVSAAARLLGIPRDTLRGQMRRLGLR
jgi:transcriptional regulator with PAS, ATPase and Fis domain